jgi:hypothetical protein
VAVAICVLPVALAAALEVVVADGVGIGSRDVATSMGGSGHETRGWEICCGAVGQLSSECHHL